jgi:hypothetical protein
MTSNGRCATSSMTIDARRPMRVVREVTARGRARGVGRYFGPTGARARLRREVRSIAWDLLGPWQTDELSAECSAWVERSIDAAVSSVCDSALSALAEELDAALETAPPDVARSLAHAKTRHEAGFG